MELFKYYSLDEAYGNRDIIIERLEELESKIKIKFEMENSDVLMIEDIDLEDHEVEELLQFFEDNDVVPYLEREDEDEDGYIDDDFLDYDDY